MKHRKKWFFLWILIPILAVAIFLFLAIPRLLDPALYGKMLQEALSKEIGREVTIGKAKLNVWGGVGIAFENFRVRDRSETFDLLHARKLIATVKIGPLVRREVRWKEMILDAPILYLLRDKNGRFNFSDEPMTPEALKESQRKLIRTLATLFGGSFTLRNGTIRFTDENLGGSPLITEVRSFNLQLTGVSYEKSFPFFLNGKILHSKREGRFSVSGTIENIPEDMDVSEGSIMAEVETKGIDLSHFWPYLKTWLPMKTVSGFLDLDGNYQGRLSGAFKAQARINFREVVYDHPQVFASIFTPKWVTLDFQIDYDTRDFKIPRYSVKLPDLSIKGKGRIYGIGTKEMGMEAEAQSDPFDLSDGKKYIPYRIIMKDTSDHLFRSEGSGSVQIVSARLSGKMAEVEHCDLPQYAHTLTAEVRVNKVRLRLPWNLPPLENFKALLLFKDGHLNLKEMEGMFLHSRIERANGVFYRLLHVPTLQIDGEGSLDLKDLPALGKIEGLSSEPSGGPSDFRVLSGKAEYRVSAKGELNPPIHFQHQGVYSLSSVQFNHTRIPFPVSVAEGRVDLSNEEARWTGMRVAFGDSSFSMSGSWKKDRKGEPLGITAKGRLDLKNLLALTQSTSFPEEIRSKLKSIDILSGKGEFSFKGQGTEGFRFSSYEGEWTPKENQVLLKGTSVPLLIREGIFSFSNSGINLSGIKVRYRDLPLTLDGSLRAGNFNLNARGSVDLRYLHAVLHSPLFSGQGQSQMGEIRDLGGEAEVRLRWSGKTDDWFNAMREGQIRLKGFTLLHRKLPFAFSGIEGLLYLSPEQIRFEELKGSLGDSFITASGAISRGGLQPGSSSVSSIHSLSFQVSSPQLNLDTLLPKRDEPASPSPLSFEGLRDWLSGWNLDGRIEAAKWKYQDLPYADLKVEMKTVDRKLLLRTFQFKGEGGDLWGEGWIEPAQKGVKFELKPRISNMEVKPFLRAVLQKGKEERIDISGRVHVNKVELRGEGEDFQKVKESLNGGLRVEFKDGVIERWNILSKIFSVLNVSQILMGRLPDLRTKGLPYHQITANISVKDGIASTEDLFVDSDSIRITLAGGIDLGKGTIDARIGVHPLVTVDSLLSKIPIAGYILTGKEKAFVSYYYEVTGDLDDPKIDAIPIKALGEGFLGFVKRLLETPLRPFQKGNSP
jgi:uncharacterized protein involved in outer membrane biogenesis